MTVIKTKLKGVSFSAKDGSDRQDNLQKVQPGFKLFWEHEHDNKYDPNAIIVYADPAKKIELGHVSAELAKKLQEYKRACHVIDIFALELTGGQGKKSFGLNVEVRVSESPATTS